MASAPTEDVIDVSDTFQVVFRAWKSIGALALGLALLVGLVTFLIPPIFEARFAVLFPRSQSSSAGSLVQMAANNSSDVQYLGGVIKSHDVRARVAELAKIRLKDVDNALDVNEMPERRQLEVAFRSGSDKIALEAVTSMLGRLKQLDQRLLFNLSDRISSDLAKDVQEKKKILDHAQDELAEFQKAAMTAPSSQEDFTGSEYIVRAQAARAAYAISQRKVQTKLDQARKTGQAIDLNLPTGDNQIAEWRKELLTARMALDTAKARYQPGTLQIKTAQQSMDAAEKAIRDELQARVVSVEKGIDLSTAALFAENLLAKWQMEEADARAKVAPEEAQKFRRLLLAIRTASSDYEATVGAFRNEDVRNTIEKLQWSVLDDPYVLEEPVNKKYALNMIAGFVVGGLIGSIVAVRRKGKK